MLRINNYYRLKQIDFDGVSEYSPTILISQTVADIQAKAYPNPTSGKISFDLENNEEIKAIKIVNQLGERIEQKYNPEKRSIDITDFPEGLYHLEIKTTSGEYFLKIIKN